VETKPTTSSRHGDSQLVKAILRKARGKVKSEIRRKAKGLQVGRKQANSIPLMVTSAQKDRRMRGASCGEHAKEVGGSKGARMNTNAGERHPGSGGNEDGKGFQRQSQPRTGTRDLEGKRWGDPGGARGGKAERGRKGADEKSAPAREKTSVCRKTSLSRRMRSG